MMTLNNVSLPVSITIFNVLLQICFRSCRIIITASHASASPKVSAPNAELPTIFDFTLAKSIGVAFYLRVRYISGIPPGMFRHCFYVIVSAKESVLVLNQSKRLNI